MRPRTYYDFRNSGIVRSRVASTTLLMTSAESNYSRGERCKVSRASVNKWWVGTMRVSGTMEDSGSAAGGWFADRHRLPGSGTVGSMMDSDSSR